MSIILAGAFWFVLLPSAAELCGLIGLQQGLLALQVRMNAVQCLSLGMHCALPRLFSKLKHAVQHTHVCARARPSASVFIRSAKLGNVSSLGKGMGTSAHQTLHAPRIGTVYLGFCCSQIAPENIETGAGLALCELVPAPHSHAAPTFLTCCTS